MKLSALFVVVATVASVTACTHAYACPDYIMSCYASKPKKEVTCITYRTSDGRLVTTCTWN